MIEKTAIDRIAELGAAEADANNRMLEIGGETYSIGALVRIEPADKRPQPTVSALAIHSLTGLVGYVKSGKDPVIGLVHVESPTRVSVVSPVFGHLKQRETFVVAEIAEEAHPWKVQHDLENFQVWLRSRFIPTDDSEGLLKMLGNVKDGAVKTAVDDGFSQEVEVRIGASLKGSDRPKNPIMLQPYRTFREVEQPMSECVVRLYSNSAGLPKVALFESDGGAWRLEAVQKIVRYLSENLAGWTVIG